MLETILRKLGYTKTSYVDYITTDNNCLINVNKKLEKENKILINKNRELINNNK